MNPVFEFGLALVFAWVDLFAAPFRNPQLLWIIIPIYINGAFAQFYQEKRSTSFGNAISNSLIPILVGWDWARTLVTGNIEGATIVQLAIKWLIVAVLIGYGLRTIYASMRLRDAVHFTGSIKVITYILLVLTPLYYGIVPINFVTLMAIIIFFPLWYFIVEVLDAIIPDPKILDEDEGKPKQPPQQQYVHPYPPVQYYAPYVQPQRRRM